MSISGAARAVEGWAYETVKYLSPVGVCRERTMSDNDHRCRTER